MAKLTVNIGQSANDRTGDNLRTAFNKINENFNELYTALGLDDNSLNLGAFEFTGSVMTTTDSSAITIDQQVTVSSDLNVGGDVVPNTDLGSSLGSATKRWKDLYVSANTIHLGSTTLGVSSGGTLEVGGSSVSSTIDYSEIQNTPTVPTLTSELTNDSGFVTSSDIFNFNITGDDSTVRTVQSGSTIGIIGGTGITTASDADGNITITGTAQDFAFSSLTGTPTTIAGYGITDAVDLTGSTFTGDIGIERNTTGTFEFENTTVPSSDAIQANGKIRFSGYNPEGGAGHFYSEIRGYQQTANGATEDGAGSIDFAVYTNEYTVNAQLMQMLNIDENGVDIVRGNLTTTEVIIPGKLFRDKVDVTVSDTYGNPGDGYTDLPITTDTSNERFRLLESAGTNGVDLPSLTDSEFGKEIYVYSDGSGSSGNNIVLVFASQNNSNATLTFSGNVFSARVFTWYGTYWKDQLAV